ncbi:lysophospholipid acyltransferase LPEAT1-like isoform X4 [Telopea speciosissima]|uniref:lysophospholipid acyltransferase LPEAT1-like isoform X4 n=1 Tax=Telopea speciosissima TaxID=54955 RepID=UPI001CC3D413|nr:lysophospholipid acyltransferase LPEAT1-like isoform X4 [Telopea speciosissima]
METELQDFESKNQPVVEPAEEPHDEGSGKDERSLLKSDSKLSYSPLVPEDLQELEKKFAAFVRRDVYGTMGRGELLLSDKLLLGFALVTLVPIRLVVGMVILILYYFICRFCTLFAVPYRDDGQEDYAHLSGWRRVVIVQSGRFLSRAMLFTLGFYWISESFRNPDAVEKFAGENQSNEQSGEPKQPAAIISNHVSYLDILYHMSSSFPSFVAKVGPDESIFPFKIFLQVFLQVGLLVVESEFCHMPVLDLNRDLLAFIKLELKFAFFWGSWFQIILTQFDTVWKRFKNTILIIDSPSIILRILLCNLYLEEKS